MNRSFLGEDKNSYSSHKTQQDVTTNCLSVTLLQFWSLNVFIYSHYDGRISVNHVAQQYVVLVSISQVSKRVIGGL